MERRSKQLFTSNGAVEATPTTSTALNMCLGSYHLHALSLFEDAGPGMYHSMRPGSDGVSNLSSGAAYRQAPPSSISRNGFARPTHAGAQQGRVLANPL